MEKSKKSFIKDIRDNYRKLETELVTQLSFEHRHNVTLGTNREEVWVNFFRHILPKNSILRDQFLLLTPKGTAPKK